MSDHDALVGAKAWRMSPDMLIDDPPWRDPVTTPTFSEGDLTARIRWRPARQRKSDGEIIFVWAEDPVRLEDRERNEWRSLALCAWELVIGERGVCSLPRFRSAGAAKLDAWNSLEKLREAA